MQTYNHDYIQIIKPNKRSPVVASVPHGGTHMPSAFSAHLTVPIEELWSDWNTRELYDFIPSIGATLVETQVSRFVSDPNRDPAYPKYGTFWKGIVPSTDPYGNEIYTHKPSRRELRERIEYAYTPYHSAIGRAVSEALEDYPRALLLDLHSFGMPLDVDVVIGDSRGKSARPETVARLETELRTAGFSYRKNAPFSGGWIIRQFNDNSLVDSIQLEINQRLYMNISDVEKQAHPPRLDEVSLSNTQRRLRAVLQNFFTRFEQDHAQIEH